MQTMKNMLNEMDEFKINQEYMSNLITKLIENSKQAEDKIHYHNKLNGGKCSFCQKEYIKKEKNTGILNYSLFYPICDCYEKIKKQQEYYLMGKTICRYSGVPEKYLNKSFKDLDLNNISADTKKAVEKIKIYIKSKAYEDGMGCMLYGDVGTGKTLLASIIFMHLILKENKSGKFIRMSDILKDVIRNNYEFVERLIYYDVILLDDLDKLKAAKGTLKSGWASERIFSMIDSIVNNKILVISTSNCQDLNELNNFFDSSVISRLIGNSEVIRVKGHDYRMIEREKKLKNARLFKNNKRS